MKTPLEKIHKELKARMVEFAGWEMPVQYSSILEEHQAVRTNAGLFDVSHMGEIELTGKDVLSNLQYLVTNNVARLKIGQVIYTPMCNCEGGIIDDLLIYRLSNAKYMMVVNASNIEKDYNWVRKNITGDTEIKNISNEYALLALQGPQSTNILDKITDTDLNSIEYYCFKKGKLAGIEAIISRTGYTGELGYELYCNPDDVEKLWRKIMKIGKNYGILPVGLGARDTLRLEKKYCLYGNDINEYRHPLEAGLSWTVHFSKGDFIGKESLLKYKESGYKQKLVGFKLIDRGIPRHGYKIIVEKESEINNNREDVDNINNERKDKAAVEIGEVTSGSYSPTLNKNIGLAYLNKDYCNIGQKIKVLIRKKPVEAVVVKTPFV